MWRVDRGCGAVPFQSLLLGNVVLIHAKLKIMFEQPLTMNGKI